MVLVVSVAVRTLCAVRKETSPPLNHTLVLSQGCCCSVPAADASWKLPDDVYEVCWKDMLAKVCRAAVS